MECRGKVLDSSVEKTSLNLASFRRIFSKVVLDTSFSLGS
jgi:hypothetical protein